MSTTTRSSRGKPVTLAKSAATDVSVPKAAKSASSKAETSKAETSKAETSKTETAKSTPVKSAAPKAAAAKPDLPKAAPPISAAADVKALPAPITPPGELDAAFHAKWNDLVKAQSDAALAWWQEVKDARTVADAIAVNARHSRLQFEMAAGQAREMATFFQKTLEGNAERLRAMLTPGQH